MCCIVWGDSSSVLLMINNLHNVRGMTRFCTLARTGDLIYPVNIRSNWTLQHFFGNSALRLSQNIYHSVIPPVQPFSKADAVFFSLMSWNDEWFE